MSRRATTLRAALLAAALAGPAARAQGAGPLAWERVGTAENVEGLFFDGDTLYAAGAAGPSCILVLRPGDADFSQAFPVDACGSDLSITPDRVLFLRWAASQLLRSADMGRTGGPVHGDALTLPVPTPGGALAVGVNEAGHVAARSTDGGATWTDHGGVGPGGLGATALAVVPPSDALPAGRLVAGGYGGVAYSDDDGRSWRPTPLYAGPTGFAAWSLVRLGGGSHAGRLLAVVQRSDGAAAVFASADGAAWAPVGGVPTGAPATTRLVAAPDGAAYAYDVAGTYGAAEGRPVYRSTDGGATWAPVGAVGDGSTAYAPEVREVGVGPDGRLYAATESRYHYGTLSGGVFRTARPVVASERPPPSGSGLRLEAHPNPSAGAVGVTLTVREAGAVRVSAYDGRGREVAVLHEGPLAAGAHALAWEAASFAPGVYVVRATAGDAHATRTVTLTR